MTFHYENQLNKPKAYKTYCSVWSHSTHFLNKLHFIQNLISVHLIEGHFNLNNYPWWNPFQDAHCQVLKCLKICNDPISLGLNSSPPPWLKTPPSWAGDQKGQERCEGSSSDGLNSNAVDTVYIEYRYMYIHVISRNIPYKLMILYYIYIYIHDIILILYFNIYILPYYHLSYDIILLCIYILYTWLINFATRLVL